MKVDILGTQYDIIKQTISENTKLENANGICEFFAKKIIYDEAQPDRMSYDNLDAFNKKVVRHEVIHAFFGESGLKDYMNDELLVDWIAVQFPKIQKVFEQLGVN